MTLAAKEAGLLVGGYHNLISGPIDSIQRQVTYFRDTLDSVGADFAMLDVEPYDALKKNGLWPRLIDAQIFAADFASQDKRRTLAIYLARWVWSGWLEKADLTYLMDLARGPLINANYSSTPDLSDIGWQSYGNVTPEIWQYTSGAIVPGASNLTDMNAYRGTISELQERLTRKGVILTAIEDVLWPGMKALEPKSQLGGILARKPGYHNSRDHLPSDDYSVAQFAVDREGPASEGSAIDWTFPSAQAGNYADISKYSKRLYAARNEGDERTKYIREFFGQIDSDSSVEGWDFSKNRASSSDSSHLWHIHISIHRKYINDAYAMKAILSILKGESLETWRITARRTVTYQYFNAKLPVLKLGDSDPIHVNGAYFVNRAQRALQVTADGDYGPITADAVQELGLNDGNTINLPVWTRLHGLWGAALTDTATEPGAKRTITYEYFGAHLPVLKYGDKDSSGLYEGETYYVTRAQRQLGITADGEYGPQTRDAVIGLVGGDGKTIDLEVWIRLYALWGAEITTTKQFKNTSK
jgi:peptidoglycan hydrolase-like protein with peptidoglycan-binding domain